MFKNYGDIFIDILTKCDTYIYIVKNIDLLSKEHFNRYSIPPKEAGNIEMYVKCAVIAVATTTIYELLLYTRVEST